MSNASIRNIAAATSVAIFVVIIVISPEHRKTGVIMLIAVLMATFFDRWLRKSNIE
jgi:hypothetical protein